MRLGEPARAIAWSDDAVTVRTDAGEVEADACVIAVPASVIGEIAFEPGLPEPLAGALASVSYGHAAKLFVPLREPAPPSAVLSVPGRYWVWTANGASGEAQPVACCFAGSAAALDRLAVIEGPAAWAASLAELRPDLDLETDGAFVSTWDDDPWVRAAYSVWVEEDGCAPAPHGPLAFAGEHTAGDWHGLMEGALRSGARAAEACSPGVIPTARPLTEPLAREVEEGLRGGRVAAPERHTRLIGIRTRGRSRADATSGPATPT